ncbi:VanZ family protein [Kitasatospora purpeofusca]|uniref:VanZ family protein n=1 Tax=Kitasatospora purpeofusca TaxID=67352 RepID=UPI002E0F199E|nr:VanZ family protein [Kitasatospora purpeofusca]
MIRAIFDNESGLLWAILVTLAVSVGLAVAIARRRSAPPMLSALAGSFTALVLAATLYPIHPGAPAPLVCTVQRDLVGAMSSPQGLMNIALFVPAAFFTTLLVRRPVSAGVFLTLLSATVEAIQAVTPGVGRSCDTADLWNNALGAVVGCGLAFLLGRRRSGTTLVANRRDLARGSLALGGGIAVIAAATVPFVTVVPADATENTQAGPAQRAAAATAFHAFFGPNAEVTSVQYVRASFEQPGTVNVTGATGSLTLAWPSGEPVTGLVGPLPAQAPGDLTEDAAVASATRFAQAHFPWALAGSQTRTDPQPNSGGARTVQWRSRVDGVLMPMRLDMLVTGSGQVSSFSARHVDPPVLPKATVTEESARNAATAAHPGFAVTSAELLAQADRDGVWHPRWMLSMRRPEGQQPAALLVVRLDATTGAPVTT